MAWARGATGNSFGVDSLAEFQLLTNTYSAQYGGNGGVLNAVSKAGTNELHGSAYEFLRNSAIQTRNYFDPAQKPPFRRNQFGFSLGGPIKKNKAFFFVNYEGLRQFLGVSTLIHTPDQAAHQGYLPNSAGVETPVISPGSAGLQSPSSCTAVYTAASNCLLGSIAPIVGLYPVATGTSAQGIGTYTVPNSQVASENYLLARFDYNFSEKDSLFVRYLRDYSQFTLQTSQVPLWPETDNTLSHIGTIEEKHIFSNNVINLVRFSFVRPGETAVVTNSVPAMQIFPGLGVEDADISVTGLLNTSQNLGPSSTDPTRIFPNRFIFMDDFLWTRGAHSLRFGGSIARVDDNTASPYRGNGVWNFNGVTQLLQNSVAQVTLGLPGQLNDARYFRSTNFAIYGQDDWTLTRKLTLNLGLRWEPQKNITEAHNNFYNIPNPVPPTGVCAGLGCFQNIPAALARNPSYWNFDPRIGLAYDPFGDHKTSVRAGFGIFHDVMTTRQFGPGFWLNPPYVTVTVTAAQATAAKIPLAFGCVTAGCSSAPILTAVTPTPAITQATWYQSDTTPYMMQYNLNIQRELPGQFVFTIGYVGSRGDHLFLGQDFNPPANTGTATDPVVGHLSTNTSGQPIVAPNPRVNSTLNYFINFKPNGISSYNALQTTLNHRFGHDFQTQIAYTWSKSLDYESGAVGTEQNPSIGGGNATSMDPYNARSDYGPSITDKRNNLTANALYTLPFHRNKFVDGWAVSGILTIESGYPFSVTTGSIDVAGLAYPQSYQRMNVAPGCTLNSAKVGTKAEWFNPLCFTAPLAGHFGTESRNGISGPGLRNLDMAILKDTKVAKISEAFDVQFRAEFFNILNHTNLGIPQAGDVTQVSGQAVNGFLPLATLSTAGTFSSPTVTPQRTLQFGLKILF